MTDMSGNAKSSKAPPSLKTGTVTEVDTEDQEENHKKEKVKEIPLFHDSGFFLHDTGDSYDGEFEIKKKDFTIKMQGHGVYKTAEGDTYSGNWEANSIDHKETTTISYNDGAKFEGFLKDWCYYGKGKYTYPDGTVLTCDFSENCPVGPLTLTDPNGHTWLGKAEHGFSWCSPVNHFYEILETTIPGAKRRHKHNVILAAEAVPARTGRKLLPAPAAPKAKTKKG